MCGETRTHGSEGRGGGNAASLPDSGCPLITTSAGMAVWVAVVGGGVRVRVVRIGLEGVARRVLVRGSSPCRTGPCGTGMVAAFLEVWVERCRRTDRGVDR